MTLDEWQERLDRHFGDLRRERTAAVGDKPIFALEHGLDREEIQALRTDVLAAIADRAPSNSQTLPWVVYAAEFGYRYAGNEYWQTFETRTPGWLEHGQRDWVRDRFTWFRDQFGGARPSGIWADQFTIICWPISHAVLPRYLQQQLAKMVYQLRHNFSASILGSPVALGELIASRSWEASSRFQNLAQDPALLGQIAAALLLEGKLGSAGLLLPATLARIGKDLEEERSARCWLKDARRLAQERAELKGLSSPRRSGTTTHAISVEDAREIVAALAIEPRLVLYRKAADGTRWDVRLEVPDLSHLLARFPDCRAALTDSYCDVAGAGEGPLWPGRLLHGPNRIRLVRWPRSDEPLLQFRRPARQLEYLLRTECLLRPGTTWLFRVASDGLAYELRSHRVRPGGRYVLASTEAPIEQAAGVRPIALSCEGVHAALLELPPSLDREWAATLENLHLNQAKRIEVWPAGVSAAGWDGEGRSEWLSTETPCVRIRADHALDSVALTLESVTTTHLDLGAVREGDPVFVEFPGLTTGLHKLRVRAVECGDNEGEVLGDLDLLIREPRVLAMGVIPQGALRVLVHPSTPTMEQLWEGHVCVEAQGPAGRRVDCSVALFDRGGDRMVTRRLPPFELPMTAGAWSGQFEKHFRQVSQAQEAYDEARACELEFKAEELGAFTIRCERSFTPIRWSVRRAGSRHRATLHDDSGAAAPIAIALCRFEAPDVEIPATVDVATASIEVGADGGMLVARRGELTATVMIPPVVKGFGDLRCAPIVADRDRSPMAAERVIQRIGLWSGARLTGGIYCESRRLAVLDCLMRHLFFIFCGETEALPGEPACTRDDERQAIGHALWVDTPETALTAALLRESEALAALPTRERISRFSELAQQYLHLSPSTLHVAGGPQTPDQLYEFALRVASDPVRAVAWIGPRARDLALLRLRGNPKLAYAAHALVLSIDRHLRERPKAAGQIYTGWEWA